MTIKVIVLGLILGLTIRDLHAGDAIAVGFTWEGVWMAVTYNRSSTPKGGPNYHDSAQACVFAERDLRSRASGGGAGPARTAIIYQSDKTGFVALAHGKRLNENKGVMTIGRGQSQEEADHQALEKLKEKAATEEPAIVYRYFSYGSEPVSSQAKKTQSATRKS